jgi:hypothetical protein
MRNPAFQIFVAASLACTLVALLPGAAYSAADPVVYHSPNDDGQRFGGGAGGGTPTTTPSPSFVLHLYMDEDNGTTTASTLDACGTGDGDERCGWDLAIETSGAIDFVAFSGSGDVVAGLTTGSLPRLVFNGGIPNTGELGVVKLGDLEISSTGMGTVFLSGGTVVSADQNKVGLTATNIITVPEPGAAISLVAGAALLSLLRTRRRARSEARHARSTMPSTSP